MWTSQCLHVPNSRLLFAVIVKTRSQKRWRSCKHSRPNADMFCFQSVARRTVNRKAKRWHYWMHISLFALSPEAVWAKTTTRHKSEGLLVIEVSFTAQHPQLSETRYCNFPSLPTRWEKTVQDVVSVAFSNSFATFRLNKTKKQSTESTKICLGCLSVHRCFP